MVHILIKIIAEAFIVLPVLLAIYEFFRLNHNLRLTIGLKVVIGGLISLLLAMIASKLIHDPRPFVTGHFTPLISHGNDNGFPSDHTLLASFLGWTLLAYSRKLGYAALGIAALIGLARMAAGIHHSWDIIGSFVISGIASLITSKVVELLMTHRQAVTK